MRLVDTVKLATTTTDGYGDLHVDFLSDVKALFIQRTGADHTLNAENIIGDAVVYLDPKDPVVFNNSYRLEGMYVIAQPFGQDQDQSWYKIVTVNVGQRKLLDNAIDNIHCVLQKAPSLAYVS